MAKTETATTSKTAKDESAQPLLTDQAPPPVAFKMQSASPAPSDPLPPKPAGIDDIDDSALLTGGDVVPGAFEGPVWAPHFVEFSPDVIKQKLERLGAGSSTRSEIGGRVHTAFAWNRWSYVLDMKVKTGDVVRVLLPEHSALWGILNNVKLGTTVRIKYSGRGTPKPGQDAPHLYTVWTERGALMGKVRDDAITPTFKERGDVPF